MKKLFYVVGTFLITLDILAHFVRMWSSHINQEIPHIQRMERLDGEWVRGDTAVIYYHDKIGGKELVCFYTGSDLLESTSVSCQPTGREWKEIQ